jgi:hypothetical protein
LAGPIHFSCPIFLPELAVQPIGRVVTAKQESE